MVKADSRPDGAIVRQLFRFMTDGEPDDDPGRYELVYRVPRDERGDHERWLLEWAPLWIEHARSTFLEITRTTDDDWMEVRLLLEAPITRYRSVVDVRAELLRRIHEEVSDLDVVTVTASPA